MGAGEYQIRRELAKQKIARIKASLLKNVIALTGSMAKKKKKISTLDDRVLICYFVV